MDKKCSFIIMISISILWLILSIVISKRWVDDLSLIFGTTLSVLIITGIAYIPGYLFMNLFISLTLINYRTTKGDTTNLILNHMYSYVITILIPAHNEEKTIYKTLESIEKQEYKGKIKVVVVNNNSTDSTVEEVKKAKKDLNIPIKLVHALKQGKNFALNLGLEKVDTKYFITLDADTMLQKNAIQNIVEKLLISNLSNKTVAVAGGVIVANGEDSFITRLQKYDYLLSITSIKKMQGLFNSTLVAQGAFSIYNTKIIREIGGWSDSIGEDIVLTWKLLQKGYNVDFEPRAVCFTRCPNSVKGFIIQRSRWARGMIEGLKQVFPFKQGNFYSKYLASIDLLIPFLDISYILFFIPGLILAIIGKYYIVGPVTLLVLPVTVICNLIMYRSEKKEVLDLLGIKLKLYLWEYICFLICYQFLSSFASIKGYMQELFKLKRKWR